MLDSHSIDVSVKDIGCYEKGLNLVIFLLVQIKNFLNAVGAVILCNDVGLLTNAVRNSLCDVQLFLFGRIDWLFQVILHGENFLL